MPYKTDILQQITECVASYHQSLYPQSEYSSEEHVIGSKWITLRHHHNLTGKSEALARVEIETGNIHTPKGKNVIGSVTHGTLADVVRWIYFD